MNAFDPYYTWLGIPPEDQPADFYRLLGVKRFETNLDVISHAADKQMMHLRSFQTGKFAPISQKLLNELAAIRICLLHPEKKAAYDQQLKSQIDAAATQGQPASANLPRAVPITPNQADWPASEEQNDALPVMSTISTKSSKRKAKPVKGQPPVWIFAVGGAAVVVVGVLAFLLLGKSEDVPPVAKRSSDSPTVHPVKPKPVQKQQPALEKTDPPPAQPPATIPQPSTNDVPPALTTPAVPKVDQTPSTDEFPTPSDDDPSATPQEDVSPEKPAMLVVTTPMAAPPATGTDEPKQPAATDATPVTDSTPAKEPVAAKTPAKALPAKKLPVPAAAEITRAESLVNEIFGAEIAEAKTPVQRSELAGKLIQNAEGTEGEDAARYVLLTQASTLAAQAGDSRLIETSADNMGEYYDVDVLKMKARGYNDASKVNLDASTSGELCDKVLALADESAARQRFDLAFPLIKVAQAFARKVKDKELFKQITARSDRLETLQTEFQAAEKAAAVLAKNPDDTAANLAYGKYLALSIYDWERALPLLSKGGEESLAAAAKADLAMPSEATAQSNLGDAWYKIASADKALQGFHVRAHYWYELALPELTGLAKTRAEKRLEETSEIAHMAAQSGGGIKGGPITAKLRLSLPEASSRVSVLAFSPNSRTIVSGNTDNEIKFWDAASGETLKTLSADADINSLVFTPDGTILISGSADQRGRFWSFPDGVLKNQIKNCSNIGMTRDGKTLAVFNANYGVTTIWDAATVQQRVALEKTPSSCGPPLISGDGKILVAANYDSIYVWSVQTGRIVYKLTGRARRMALSPDGKLLATTNDRGQLTIWNLTNGTERHSMPGDESYVNALAFSPDGGTLVSGGTEQKLRFWDPYTGELRVDVPDDVGYCSAIAFSPNGKMIATGSWNAGLKLWDVEKLQASPGNSVKK